MSSHRADPRSSCRLKTTAQVDELRCYWLGPSHRGWASGFVMLLLAITCWLLVSRWHSSGSADDQGWLLLCFMAAVIVVATRYALGVTVLRYDGHSLEIRRGPLMWPRRFLIPPNEIGQPKLKMQRSYNDDEYARGGESMLYSVFLTRHGRRPVWIIRHQPSWASAQSTIKSIEAFFKQVGIR